MYTPIFLDLEGILDDFKLAPENVSELTNRIIDSVVAGFLEKLDQRVQFLSPEMRELYLSSIIIEKNNENEREVVLKGWLPNALESGLPAFDMKIGFKNSSKVKFNKWGGWYLTIPLGKAEIKRTKPNIPESTAAKDIKGKFNKVPSGNISFLRVGEKTKGDSFIHPGFSAKDFFGQAMYEFENLIPQITSSEIDKVLRDFGFK